MKRYLLALINVPIICSLCVQGCGLTTEQDSFSEIASETILDPISEKMDISLLDNLASIELLPEAISEEINSGKYNNSSQIGMGRGGYDPIPTSEKKGFYRDKHIYDFQEQSINVGPYGIGDGYYGLSEKVCRIPNTTPEEPLPFPDTSSVIPSGTTYCPPNTGCDPFVEYAPIFETSSCKYKRAKNIGSVVDIKINGSVCKRVWGTEINQGIDYNRPVILSVKDHWEEYRMFYSDGEYLYHVYSIFVPEREIDLNITAVFSKFLSDRNVAINANASLDKFVEELIGVTKNQIDLLLSLDEVDELGKFVVKMIAEHVAGVTLGEDAETLVSAAFFMKEIYDLFFKANPAGTLIGLIFDASLGPLRESMKITEALKRAQAVTAYYYLINSITTTMSGVAHLMDNSVPKLVLGTNPNIPGILEHDTGKYSRYMTYGQNVVEQSDPERSPSLYFARGLVDATIEYARKNSIPDNEEENLAQTGFQSAIASFINLYGRKYHPNVEPMGMMYKDISALSLYSISEYMALSMKCLVNESQKSFTISYPVDETGILAALRVVDFLIGSQFDKNSVHDPSKILWLDYKPPALTAPPNITKKATGVKTTVDLGEPVVSDRFLKSVGFYGPNDGFPVGNTNVIWEAKDTSGNTTRAAQTVKIVK